MGLSKLGGGGGGGIVAGTRAVDGAGLLLLPLLPALLLSLLGIVPVPLRTGGT